MPVSSEPELPVDRRREKGHVARGDVHHLPLDLLHGRAEPFDGSPFVGLIRHEVDVGAQDLLVSGDLLRGCDAHPELVDLRFESVRDPPDEGAPSEGDEGLGLTQTGALPSGQDDSRFHGRGQGRSPSSPQHRTASDAGRPGPRGFTSEEPIQISARPSTSPGSRGRGTALDGAQTGPKGTEAASKVAILVWGEVPMPVSESLLAPPRPRANVGNLPALPRMPASTRLVGQTGTRSWVEREAIASLVGASAVLGIGAALIDSDYTTPGHGEWYYYGWVLFFFAS